MLIARSGAAAVWERLRSAANPALLFGVRLCASVSLAFLVAFWLQLDNPYWAATSATIVAQTSLGASLRKGRFRSVGTVVGGVVAVLLIMAFPQHRVPLFGSLILWVAFCGYLAIVLPHFAGYGAALAGFTTVIILGGVTQAPENVFMVTVWRVSEICIGVFCTGLVHVLTDYGDARKRLSGALEEMGRAIASGVAAGLRSGIESPALRATRRQLIGSAIRVEGLIDTAMGEPSRSRVEGKRLRGARHALFGALAAWRGLGDHPGCKPDVSGPWTGTLEKLAAEDWRSHPERVRTLCRSAQDGAPAAAADLAARVTDVCMRRVMLALEQVSDALGVLMGQRSAPVPTGRAGFHVPDHLPPLRSAVRVAAALTVAILLWVLTAWPKGPTVVTFTAVNVMLAVRQADVAYRWAVQYTLGCVLAALLAVILDLVILPGIHGGFPSLVVALSAVLLPLAALYALDWQQPFFNAALHNLMPIVALENTPVYDGAALLNGALAVSTGAVIAVGLIWVFPPLSAAQRIQRLLKLSVCDLRRLLGRERRFSADEWMGRLSARLATMPTVATPEQDAQLLAMFSIGQCVIALRDLAPAPCSPSLLEQAFRDLCEGRVGEARAALVQFAAEQPMRCAADASAGTHPVDAAVEATLIADALARHGALLAAGGP